ncbi:MAG: serine protease [Fidelibacterota bacterium]
MISSKGCYRLLTVMMMVSLLLVSCAPRIIRVPITTDADGEYDAQFPVGDASRELQEISLSTRQIHSISYYKSYVFPPESKITASDIRNIPLKQTDTRIDYFNNSVYGTATIIYHRGDHIALLTCAHIVVSPDTLLSYLSAGGQEYLESISVKIDESHSVIDLPESGNPELEILGMDLSSDIAVLTAKLPRIPEAPIPVFSYPIGKSGELKWGTFVYLIGYPMGFKMITRGVTSLPDSKKTGSFLMDVPFNEGMSGGIVLALRDGVPNFELVGMAKSVSANFTRVLSPEEEKKGHINPRIPYTGHTFVRQLSHINYGVTFTTSSEEILKFFRKHQKAFLKEGFDFSRLIEP